MNLESYFPGTNLGLRSSAGARKTKQKTKTGKKDSTPEGITLQHPWLGL